MNTVNVLLEHGADPNAVAKDDVMPLNLAMQCSESPAKDTIVEALQNRYCRVWRHIKCQTVC